MFKKNLIAVAVAGIMGLGAATAAHAHKTGERHRHNGQNYDYRYDDYRPKHRNNYNNDYRYKKHANRQADRHYYDEPRHRGGKHGWNQGWGWAGLPPFAIRQTLRARGYRKIRFKDRHLPLYVVKACKHGKRFKIGLNRWGGIMWRQPRGYCGPRRHYY